LIGAILLAKGWGLHYLVPSAKADGNEDAVYFLESDYAYLLLR